MRQLLILMSFVVKFTLCHSQEYAQNNILNYKANNIHHQINTNKYVPTVKNENFLERVEYEFDSEINLTNQLLVNLNLNSNSNLSIIDVLSTNKYTNVDHEMHSITMKDKNEVMLYINDVKLQVSDFQLYQLLNNMSTSSIKSIEIINVPGYKSLYSANIGIIKIRKK